MHFFGLFHEFKTGGNRKNRFLEIYNTQQLHKDLLDVIHRNTKLV